MLERILVPLDGSELSELALPYCEELAGRLHSEVHLLYVCEPADVERRHVYEAYLQTISQLIGGAVKAHIPGSTDVAVRAIVLVGNPATEMTNYAEKSDINLIVMASHGRSGPMPWAIGSTAARVTQQLHVPVLLVRVGTTVGGRAGSELFGRILMPLDGSEAGEAAVPYVRELAQQIEMEVVLLQVIASGQQVHTVGGLDYFNFPEQLVERMRLEASAYLEKVRAQLTGTKTIVRCEIKSGNAAQEIVKFSDENDVRLVAMSSHGHSGIQRWVLGSVSYKVLHNGKTPLLLVRARPKE